MKGSRIRIEEALEGIRVFNLEDFNRDFLQSAKDENFYKIFLVKNYGRVNAGTVLIFINPEDSLSTKNYHNYQNGFLCVFSKYFFTEEITLRLNALSINENRPLYYRITEKQELQLITIFNHMLVEINSQYVFKYDLLRNYISEITHIALKSLAGKEYRLPVKAR